MSLETYTPSDKPKEAQESVAPAETPAVTRVARFNMSQPLPAEEKTSALPPSATNPETPEVSRANKNAGPGRDDGLSQTPPPVVDDPTAAGRRRIQATLTPVADDSLQPPASPSSPADQTVQPLVSPSLPADQTVLPPVSPSLPTDQTVLPPVSPSLPTDQAVQPPASPPLSADCSIVDGLVVFKTDRSPEGLGGMADRLNAENADINKANRELFEARQWAKDLQATTGLTPDQYREQSKLRLDHPELFDGQGAPSAPVSPSLPATDAVLPPVSPSLPMDATVIPPVSPSLPATDAVLPPISPSLPTDETVIPPVSPSLPAADAVLPPVSPSLPADQMVLPPVSPSAPTDQTVLPPVSPSAPADQTGLPPISPALPNNPFPVQDLPAGWHDLGLVNVPVDQLPTPEGVTGPQDFNHHISWADAQAATALLPQIQQEVAAGKTADDFSAEDAAAGLDWQHGKRRVFDLFFSTKDPVRLDYLDGQYHLISGRHRTFTAQTLGLKTIPAWVIAKKSG